MLYKNKSCYVLRVVGNEPQIGSGVKEILGNISDS